MGQQPDHQQADGGDTQTHQGHASDVGAPLCGEVFLQLVDVGHHCAQRQFEQQRPAGVGAGDAEGQVEFDAVLGFVELIVEVFASQGRKRARLLGIQHITGFSPNFDGSRV